MPVAISMNLCPDLPPAGLHVLFNHTAIIEYSRDNIVGGRIAFLRSHYGEERALWVGKVEREVQRKHKELVE